MRLRLTGEHAIDVADASGTLLFDVARRRWSDEVLRRARDPASSGCRRCRESTDDRAARATRRPARSASASSGPGPLSVVLGTSGVVFAALPAYRADPEARVHVFCHAVPGTWHAMGVMLSRRRLAARGCATRSRAASYRRARRPRPRRWPPGAEGLLSCRTSRASARRTPTRTRAARSSGSRSATTAARSSRAVLEGVAYGLRDSLELLRALGVEAEVGRVSGGGARSDALAARSSRRCSSCRSSGPQVEEGAAFGAALLAGVAPGAFADAQEAVAACVRVRDRIEPRPDWVAAYAEGYARYRALYPALRPLEQPHAPREPREGANGERRSPLRTEHDLERGAAPGRRP